ncbi:MAG: C4-type zinc ribbon domain-containing protein [Rikenellaceae bacterium]
MATKAAHATEAQELSIDKKIEALYQLQLIDSQIDAINHIKGELPLEVADLEDEVAGFGSRIQSLTQEIDGLNQKTKHSKEDIEKSNSLIARYTEQQKEVRNNREYESLNKELEYQLLEIELSEKHIKEFSAESKAKKKQIEEIKVSLEHRKADLGVKQEELNNIESETSKEIETLTEKSEAIASVIDDRLLTAYHRIRHNVRNGLAVVTVERNACGGCFNRIPPQRQLDIRMNKKIIVCEYCGRILVPSTEEML